MKTIKLTLSSLLCFGILLVSCEFNNKLTRSVKVESFEVNLISDTVPGEVHVISNIKVNGYAEPLYMHKGAYTASEGGEQTDSTSYNFVSNQESISNDTLILFYLKEGNYQISLKTMSETYSKEFEIYP